MQRYLPFAKHEEIGPISPKQSLAVPVQFQIFLAIFWPNFNAHRRTVSSVKSMKLAFGIASTIRRLSGKRKYSLTV
jgi:hypothetical protein